MGQSPRGGKQIRSYFYDDVDSVVKSLRTNKKDGLSLEEAKIRFSKYGPNGLKTAKKASFLIDFLKQFTDLLIIILILAAVFSTVIGSYKDGIVIFAIVLINALIGSVQEFKAEKTISALSSHLPQNATVFRGADRKIIKALELVPGDLIYLSEGEKVPADIRLVLANELLVNEAILTGESEPKLKVPQQKEDADVETLDLTGSLFAGTQIVSGNGLGIVVATGMKTQIGSIATAANEIRAQKSPLEKETDRIAKLVGKSFLVVAVILLGAFYLINKYFNLYEGLLFATQIAAAIVPEGLPAIISVALTIGARQMAARKTAIKRLSTVETMGEITVIVTDKTGTLTKGEMTAKEIYAFGNDYHVGGVGYSLSGEVAKNEKVLKNAGTELKELFMPAIIASNAEIDNVNHAKTEYQGDSTELALLVAAEKAGFGTYEITHNVKVLEEIPFSSERKFMAKAIEAKNGQQVYFKGAPSEILKMCTRILLDGKVREITENDRHKILAKNDEFSNNALRVIAVAQKERQNDSEPMEKNLIFVGLLGIIDPPRSEIKETIRIAKTAGIRTILVTGDHGLTAAAIAKRIGLSPDPKVIEGKELDAMHDKELEEALKEDGVIFARVNPNHKLRIVNVLQKMHEIVAVTGDGVNDSPALKAADAGIAMGITGTDVSREAAGAVILNDSYSSIVWAVREGRIVYENIEKFIKFEFTTHVAALSTVMAGIFIGTMPLFAIQILLMDYGAESFSALALGADSEEDDVMSRPPRKKNQALASKENIFYVLRSGIGLSVTGVCIFLLILFKEGWSFGNKIPTNLLFSASAITYATFAFGQVLNSFSLRSKSKPIYKLFTGNKYLVWAALASILFVITLIYVPGLNNFVKMFPPPAYAWLYVFAGSILFGLYLEVLKFIYKKQNN